LFQLDIISFHSTTVYKFCNDVQDIFQVWRSIGQVAISVDM